MSSQPLTLAELQSLVVVMRETFSFIAGQRAEKPVAAYVQFPKIPPYLSESLAVHLISSGRVLQGVREPYLAGRTADIIARDPNGAQLHIEVKGTGTSEWVFLGEKDYEADWLIWISFDDFFANRDTSEITVYCIRPADIPDRRQRITLQTLGQVLRGALRGIQLDLNRFLAGG